MLNNGLHTVHHENPNMHWSLARHEHDQVAHLIAPQLKSHLLWYFFSTYFLGIFFKRFRTQSMRLERIQATSQEVVNNSDSTSKQLNEFAPQNA